MLFVCNNTDAKEIDQESPHLQIYFTVSIFIPKVAGSQSFMYFSQVPGVVIYVTSGFSPEYEDG